MCPGLTPFSLRVRIAVLCPFVAALVTCDLSSTDVTVTVPVATVEVAPGTGTVEMGQILQLTATPKDATGNVLDRTVTWSSSDPAVATVDGNGLVTGSSEGTAIITATSGGMGGTATVKVIEPGAYNCSVQSQIRAVECWALVALYGATNGPGWRESTGWLANITPCSWEGVICADGAVSQLSLTLNQLTGPIPAELGNLSDLEVLYLPGNQLTGPIPPELGNLSDLRELELSWNQLTGPIPAELGNLSNLLELHFYLNHLTGPIPTELGNLSDLETLALSGNGNPWSPSNQFSGLIPAELGNLTALRVLDLSGNQLSNLVPLQVAQRGGQIQDTHGADSCVFRPPGNDDLSIPDTQEYRNAGLDGDGLICGLGFTAVPTSAVAPPDDREVDGFKG